MLNREQLLAAQLLPAGSFKCDALGGDIGIRQLSVQDIVDLRGLAGNEDTSETVCRFATRILCDATGKRMFTDEEWTLLMPLPLAVLLDLGREARRLNGLDKESGEAREKNSETGQT